MIARVERHRRAVAQVAAASRSARPRGAPRTCTSADSAEPVARVVEHGGSGGAATTPSGTAKRPAASARSVRSVLRPRRVGAEPPRAHDELRAGRRGAVRAAHDAGDRRRPRPGSVKRVAVERSIGAARAGSAGTVPPAPPLPPAAAAAAAAAGRRAGFATVNGASATLVVVCPPRRSPRPPRHAGRRRACACRSRATPAASPGTARRRRTARAVAARRRPARARRRRRAGRPTRRRRPRRSRRRAAPRGRRRARPRRATRAARRARGGRGVGDVDRAAPEPRAREPAARLRACRHGAGARTRATSASAGDRQAAVGDEVRVGERLARVAERAVRCRAALGDGRELEQRPGASPASELPRTGPVSGRGGEVDAVARDDGAGRRDEAQAAHASRAEAGPSTSALSAPPAAQVSATPASPASACQARVATGAPLRPAAGVDRVRRPVVGAERAGGQRRGSARQRGARDGPRAVVRSSRSPCSNGRGRLGDIDARAHHRAPGPRAPPEPSAVLQPEVAHAELVEPDVMGELVADRDRDLLAQQVGVVAEVAPQRVAEDDDPVGVVVAGRAVALVEAVGAVAAPLVGDRRRRRCGRAPRAAGRAGRPSPRARAPRSPRRPSGSSSRNSVSRRVRGQRRSRRAARCAGRPPRSPPRTPAPPSPRASGRSRSRRRR